MLDDVDWVKVVGKTRFAAQAKVLLQQRRSGIVWPIAVVYRSRSTRRSGKEGKSVTVSVAKECVVSRAAITKTRQLDEAHYRRWCHERQRKLAENNTRLRKEVRTAHFEKKEGVAAAAREVKERCTTIVAMGGCLEIQDHVGRGIETDIATGIWRLMCGTSAWGVSREVVGDDVVGGWMVGRIQKDGSMLAKVAASAHVIPKAE